MSKLIKRTFYLMGVVSTLNALMIKIGGNQLALLNFIIIVLIILQLFSGEIKLTLYKYKIGLICLLIVFLVSSVGSMYNTNLQWFNESIKVSVKYVLFLVPLCLIFGDKELIKYRIYYLKGLLISAYIQLAWEILQLALWHYNSSSLNEIVFDKMLKIQSDHTWTFISNGQFRPSGVSWEPANLGMALIVGFILSKDIKGKILFSIGIFLSTSRTSILMWSLCVVIYLFIYIKNQLKLRKTVVSSKFILMILLIVILGIILTLIKGNYIINSILLTLDKLKISNQMNDSSSLTHAGYYLKAFDIFRKENLYQILLGYGTKIAGYPYTKFFGIYDWINAPWTPESDFVTILFGNGIIGFLLYYKFMLSNLKYNRYDKKNYLLIVNFIFGGMLYVYIGSTWTLLTSIILFVNRPKQIKILIKG